MHQRKSSAVKRDESSSLLDDSIANNGNGGVNVVCSSSSSSASSPSPASPPRHCSTTISHNKPIIDTSPNMPWGVENNQHSNKSIGGDGDSNNNNNGFDYGKKYEQEVNGVKKTLFTGDNKRTTNTTTATRRNMPRRRRMEDLLFNMLVLLLMVCGLFAIGIYIILDQQQQNNATTSTTRLTSIHATDSGVGTVTTTTTITMSSTRGAVGSSNNNNSPWWANDDPNIVIADNPMMDRILKNKKSTRQVLHSNDAHDEDTADLKPIILKGVSTSGKFYYPERLSDFVRDEGMYMDFGGLLIDMFEDEGQYRQIYHNHWLDEGFARQLDQERDDDMQGYYAFDDDYERNPAKIFDDDVIRNTKQCRRNSWHQYNLRNCNLFHELDLPKIGPEYVGEGVWREAFALNVESMNSIESLIFKEIRWHYDLGYEAYEYYEYMRVDALISERLTSSNRIVDIYGYCGLSILTEYLPYGDADHWFVGIPERNKKLRPNDDEYDVHPYNNFTAPDKLFYALEMAEAILLLHDFPDGRIVHDDIQLVQFLFTQDDHIKLNDMNRAEVLTWDEENQEYCKYRNGRGHGDWRSPEEYYDKPLNEKIDVWSLGNNIYSLLTGLYPFYTIETDKKIQGLIKNGSTGYIDPRYKDRSFEEAVLVHVIERCWEYEPEDRASMNEIVEILRKAMIESKKLQEEEEEEYEYAEDNMMYYDENQEDPPPPKQMIRKSNKNNNRNNAHEQEEEKYAKQPIHKDQIDDNIKPQQTIDLDLPNTNNNTKLDQSLHEHQNNNYNNIRHSHTWQRKNDPTSNDADSQKRDDDDAKNNKHHGNLHKSSLR